MMNSNRMAKLAIAIVLSNFLLACGRPSKSATDRGNAGTEPVAAVRQADFTAGQIQSYGIELAQAGPASIREVLPLYGVIALNAERVRDVTARFAGVIRSARGKIGDTVKRGDVLATIESNESLQTYAVVSPINGIIMARNANPGEQSGDRTLFTVADLSTVWVELSLFPRDVDKVRPGQRVLVRGTDTDLGAEGELIFVAPFGQSSNQTLVARVLLVNADRRWAPGLYVTADVVTSENRLPLTIRKAAIQQVNGAPTVFVRSATGFEARQIQLGRSDADTAEVLSGLSTGDSYATANSYVVKAEMMKSEAAED